MSKYQRNAQRVLANLKENQAGQIIAKEACKIQVPVRFSEIGLGEIGINTYTYGLFAVILESGEYAVCNINAIVELQPYKQTLTTINEVEYHEFHFEPGSVVIKTTDLVKREPILYRVFDEFIFKGKVPWYVEYEDLGKLFDTAKHHAGSNVSQNLEVIEFIASMITRSSKDRTKYIRNVISSFGDLTLSNIDYVPLKSVFYSVNSTLNKIAGSYYNDGIASALVNPSNEVGSIEAILRT